MRLHLLLRAIAIGIAIAGLIDPARTISRPPAQKLVVIRAASGSSDAIEQALRAALPGWESESREADAKLPCGPGEHCALIADGSRNVIVPDDLIQPLSLIALRTEGAPNVSLRSVSIARAHQDGAAMARVELAGEGSGKGEIRILDGTAVVGSATCQWTDATTTVVDVPWWPAGPGARTLRVEVLPLERERTLIDNHIDVGATVVATRASVLVFDTRPSWSSTFVRRALEDDPRFAVGHRARLAPALSAGTASGRLDAAALDLASVVVSGAPDGLTAEDVALLEQFVRVRGGTLIFLPERSPSGPWSRLIAGAGLRQSDGGQDGGQAWTEHLTTTPERVGALHASEILRAQRLPVTASVVARSGPSPSIVVLPSGNGRIVVSGAMDAWRYRGLDAGAFDAFWRSLIAEGAAWGEGLQLTFDQHLAARGSRARFTVDDRRMAPVRSSEASAVARCGDGPARTIRLWPAGRVGAFTGELPLEASGSSTRRSLGEGGCHIEVTSDGRHVAGSIAVADQPAFGVETTLAHLGHRVAARGGLVVRAGEEATVARALTSALSPNVATTTHPMRPGWWILPFAGCLSIEWWLRRRKGLR